MFLVKTKLLPGYISNVPDIDLTCVYVAPPQYIKL